MQLTIQVEPVNPDQDFTLNQLKLHHGECGGGLIKGKDDGNKFFWDIRCSRCGIINSIRITADGTAAIAKTAIDGEQRTINHDRDWGGPVVAVRYQANK